MKSNLLDKLQRPLRDLRISVTDRCNFRCVYCMPEELFKSGYTFMPSEQMLSFDEIVRTAKLFVRLGVKKIRLTGGEPLLRKDLPALIKELHNIEGLEDIGLTTNGSLLKKFAKDLYIAGLRRITVSLDSLDAERFSMINGHRCKLTTVMDGIHAALNVGMIVKINMVVKKGQNEEDIIPMAKFCKQHKLILRFIEYMDVGNSNGWQLEEVVTKQQILNKLNEQMPVKQIKENYTGEVATRYQYLNSSQEIGIISSVTDTFCATCSRIRLSADGKLYTCLFASAGHDLRSLIRSEQNDDIIINKISQIWNGRHDRYSEERSNLSIKQKKKIEMSSIGG
ncbi:MULTISPECIES: GTP 3',8-cyclase MoaA [unclassified Niallia]|uniref:GTP 3',8-cyclase MoaA n=1 Tax=unclassified Niallia TaxID=2837522 RepID=UPI001ED9D391|nr:MULTISPECIES: GTP 3',8-cyclase MoaA [unclassified Niallia]MCM3030968.1 GTP 3',8-cyclase MoaA [Niallia sp. MER 6]UPO90485.1 GTP 3',8-cyclase MoaA [Niallia sp. Man26]